MRDGRLLTTLLDLPARTAPLAVLDFEMTGLDPGRDRVCEVAIVRAEGGRVVETWQSLVRPPVPVSPGALRVHGLSDGTLASAPTWAEIADEVERLLDGAVVVAHNAPFDLGFLHREMEAVGRAFAPPVAIDTLLIARRLFAFRKNSLDVVAKSFKVALDAHHRALADARATFEVYGRMLEVLDPTASVTVGELNDLLGALAPNSPLRLRQERLVREAFRRRETLWIDYQSTGDPTEGLVRREIGIFKLKLPYFQAWCYLREGERVFRMDRVVSVAPGGRTYEIPEFEARI